MKNEVMEKLEVFLQNLRCENMHRETLVHLESCKEEIEKLQEQKEEYLSVLEKLDSSARGILTSYVDQMQAAAFEEQQEAYLQGLMDSFQILCGLGIIKANENVENIIAQMKNGSSE